MARRRWKIEDIQAVLDDQKPFIQSGYTNPKLRKVGDIWEDGKGKKWKKVGPDAVVSVNDQVDSIRNMLKQNCSVCGMDMKWGRRLDEKTFKKNGMCYDCTIEHDTNLRLTGQWENYEKKKMLGYQLGYLKDMRKYIQESIDYLSSNDGKMTFVDSMGGIETWTDDRVDMLIKSAREDYSKLTKDIEDTEKLIASLDDPTAVPEPATEK